MYLIQESIVREGYFERICHNQKILNRNNMENTTPDIRATENAPVKNQLGQQRKFNFDTNHNMENISELKNNSTSKESQLVPDKDLANFKKKEWCCFQNVLKEKRRGSAINEENLEPTEHDTQNDGECGSENNSAAKERSSIFVHSFLDTLITSKRKTISKQQSYRRERRFTGRKKKDWISEDVDWTILKNYKSPNIKILPRRECPTYNDADKTLFFLDEKKLKEMFPKTGKRQLYSEGSYIKSSYFLQYIQKCKQNEIERRKALLLTKKFRF